MPRVMVFRVAPFPPLAEALGEPYPWTMASRHGAEQVS